MAEVLMEFAELVFGSDGTPYRAQASGGVMSDGLWEGWIEFIPLTGGAPLRSPRETTQPKRADTIYWATGLTPVYLEGALVRAHRSSAAMEQRSPGMNEAPSRYWFQRPRPLPRRRQL